MERDVLHSVRIYIAGHGPSCINKIVKDVHIKYPNLSQRQIQSLILDWVRLGELGVDGNNKIHARDWTVPVGF